MKVVAYTDDGQVLASFEVDYHAAWMIPDCPMNRATGRLLSGLRRAAVDADRIVRGEDPERPSEKAMRLATASEEES